jgi:hypothetical protein
MNKKILPFLIILIISLLLIPTPSQGNLLGIINKIEPFIPDHGMDVIDMSYGDALYNGTTISYPLEWYYFDSVLSDGYSVEFHLICGPTDTVGVVSPMVNIYKDGQLIFHDAKYQYINTFEASENSLKIWYDDKILIEGWVNDQNQWDLFLNYSVENMSINLRFNSVSQPWKAMVLDMWWWAVLIPNSVVKGTITIDDQKTIVTGNGYVEHAWEGRIPTVWGWYWGKFVGKNLSVIWSEIFENPFERYLVMVVNELNGSYISIPYEDISIHFKDFHFNDFWLIPKRFDFKVNSNQISLDLKAEAINIIHQTSIVSFNYWRYHVHITGTISYKGQIEHIDNIQIMDLTRFY